MKGISDHAEQVREAMDEIHLPSTMSWTHNEPFECGVEVISIEEDKLCQLPELNMKTIEVHSPQYEFSICADSN